MKNAVFMLAALIVAAAYMGFKVNRPGAAVTTVSTFGKQPAVAVDRQNSIKVVFGQGEEIFYAASGDGGQSFGAPVRVARQPKMALGMTRGPQIVATRDYTVIAAAGFTGKIMAYRLRNGEATWSQPVNILGADTTAKEGFITLASGPDNVVYAAWLDMRLDHKNNIFSAVSPDGGKTWSNSTLVYAAPEGRVCPCCRPAIAADGKGNVYVMFRNEWKGARDMYLAQSRDGGKSFAPARKLGMGTWNLKACPMDGGGIALDAQGKVGTAWRRENTVYYAGAGDMEQKVGEGRACTLAKTARGNYIVWQQQKDIVALRPGKLAPETIGSGSYPRVATLKDQSAVSVWEAEGQILAKRLD
jgi:BNR repeat-like domain